MDPQTRKADHDRTLDELERRWRAGEIPDPRAVAIVMQDPNRRVLLQLRDPEPGLAFAGHWTLPGGRVEEGEEPEAAAGRELLEEIGAISELRLCKEHRRWHHDRGFRIH